MDHDTREQLSRIETTLTILKLLLGAVIVFLVVHVWGVEKPAQVGFIAALVLVVVWLCFRGFLAALKSKPGWNNDAGTE